MRCPNCSTLIPHHAAYCPKCGRPAPATTQPPLAHNAHPATTPIPRSGKLFILFTLIGLGILLAGFATNNFRLVLLGGAILGLIVLVGLIGHHVS
jgi:hypothetical protein